MNVLRKILTVFCAAMLILSCASLTVIADDANVTYTENSGKLIFEPGSKHSPTDLFANFKNVMPGASLTQKITVSNKADNKVKVKIYLRSLGSADEKYNEFLNQLTLTVTKDTETPMFEAAADKTAGLTDWVCLGTLYSGGSLDLNVTLDVPITLDNMFQKKIGKIKWQFVTEEFEIEEPKWKCPVNEKHSWHIDVIDGKYSFVCDDCGKSKLMRCEICDGQMQQVMFIIIGDKSYTVYPDGEKHFVTLDGKVHFYMDDDGIIDYYIVDGKKIDIRSVNEYTLYTYYECINNKQHHTDPKPSPHTGDSSHVEIWLAVMIISGLLLVILLFLMRRKDDEKVRAKC